MMTDHEIKKRKNNSKKMIFFGLISALFFIFLFTVFSHIQHLVTTPNSPDPSKVEFVIEPGQGLKEISSNLRQAELIKNRFVFVLYLKYEGKAGNVLAGDYKIARNLSMTEVADIIVEGNIYSRRVTFPEGWTIEDMADRLAENRIVTRADFVSATEQNHDYYFLTDKPEEASLEGYLYPDTYEFAKDVIADEIVKTMLDNFEKKFTDDLRVKAEASNLSIFEIVTLASIVEREVSEANDRGLVASVFLNRLSADMPLESCATIQFITSSDKTRFTYEETRIDHIYNTYINKGLPPGPIGNPSIDSIRAVLEPRDSDYLYFLSAEGTTYFSYTLDEHNIKKERYLD